MKALLQQGCTAEQAHTATVPGGREREEGREGSGREGGKREGRGVGGKEGGRGLVG